MLIHSVECKCGGFGYTIEQHEELGEIMTGCFACFVKAQEAGLETADLEQTIEMELPREFLDLEKTQELPVLSKVAA